MVLREAGSECLRWAPTPSLEAGNRIGDMVVVAAMVTFRPAVSYHLPKYCLEWPPFWFSDRAPAL